MGGNFYLLLALATLASASIPTSAIVNNIAGPRQRRSFKIPVIGSLFGGGAEPQIPHLGTYPLWKVHRYHGISLQPVPYPGETVPSTLPISPSLYGEPPSIVNVPDPNYFPVDAPAPPPNEYGVPASAPAPGPYPSAPPAPVYNAPLPSRVPRGPVATVEANAVEFASPPSTGSEVDFSTLQNLLPQEFIQRFQQYASTPGGQERVNALFGIAENAKKLKTNAARSIQGVFEKFFGGAGGSTNVALQSGTYTNIPGVYPAPQGVLNRFRAVGTGISGSLLPSIPEVPPLPEIPGLQPLPPTPQLPHINLPDISHLSTTGLGGNYVSIQLPQAPGVSYSPPEQSYNTPPPPAPYSPPAQQYSPPAQQYSPPAQQYSPPAQQYSPPAQQYSPPAQQYSPPAQQYSAPVPEIPSTSYGTPAGPIFSYPQSSGSATSSYFQAPSPIYGAPDASFAASETQEQYESRDGEVKPEAEVETGESQPQVPLKTTKLHRVQSSRPLVEGLRSYLDSKRVVFRPSRTDFRAVDQNKQTDNEIDEDVQE